MPGYLVSLALALSSYCLRHVQGVQLPLPLLFVTPFACLVFLENFSFMSVDGVFGSGFEEAITFGSLSLFGIHLWPRLLLPYWLVGAAARELASLFSLFLFHWSLRHSEVNGWGAGMGLPIGLFLFQLWGLPVLSLV